MRWANMETLDSDVLVDPEFFRAYQSKSGVEPERALLLAVLSDALDTFRKFAFCNSPRARKHLRDVQQWIWEDRPDYFFSFENVCQLVGLDPQYLRQRLVNWAAQGAKGRKVRFVKLGRPKYHTVYKQRASLRRCRYQRLGTNV